jgi:hypothetical protein
MHPTTTSTVALLSTTDWVLIGTSLLLAITALVVPYLSELLKRRMFAPRLVINFEEKPPGCHKTRIKVQAPNILGNIVDEPVFYFRFQVANEGKSQAKNCEAVVENVLMADAAGNFSENTRHTPVNLIWGSSYGEFVNINPGRRFFCDLLNVPSTAYQSHPIIARTFVDPPGCGVFPLGAILNVKAAFYSQPNRLPQGKYRVDVVVYSENSKEVRRRFILSWSGTWREDEEEMFKQLVIQ